MARSAWSSNAARHEIDQRSRHARLQLEELERSMNRRPQPAPPARPVPPEHGKDLYRLVPGGYPGRGAKGSLSKG